MSEYLIIGRMGDMATMGKRGTVVVPVKLRKKFKLEEGSAVLFEERPEGLVIRPAVTVPVETWSLARKAAFLLENAVDEKDYLWARGEVERMGIDPDSLRHGKPRS